MNLKRLEEAKRAFEVLQKLDQEIIQIEKIAMDIANNKRELKFSLGYEDTSKSKESVLDSDGSIIPGGMYSFSSMSSIWSPIKETPPVKEIGVNEVISDTQALQMLGVLLHDKQLQRSNILEVFEKWGIDI